MRRPAKVRVRSPTPPFSDPARSTLTIRPLSMTGPGSSNGTCGPNREAFSPSSDSSSATTNRENHSSRESSRGSSLGRQTSHASTNTTTRNSSTSRTRGKQFIHRTRNSRPASVESDLEGYLADCSTSGDSSEDTDDASESSYQSESFGFQVDEPVLGDVSDSGGGNSDSASAGEDKEGCIDESTEETNDEDEPFEIYTDEDEDEFLAATGQDNNLSYPFNDELSRPIYELNSKAFEYGDEDTSGSVSAQLSGMEDQGQDVTSGLSSTQGDHPNDSEPDNQQDSTPASDTLEYESLCGTSPTWETEDERLADATDEPGEYHRISAHRPRREYRWNRSKARKALWEASSTTEGSEADSGEDDLNPYQDEIDRFFEDAAS